MTIALGPGSPVRHPSTPRLFYSFPADSRDSGSSPAERHYDFASPESPASSSSQALQRTTDRDNHASTPGPPTPGERFHAPLPVLPESRLPDHASGASYLRESETSSSIGKSALASLD